MRQLADKTRIAGLMRELARVARQPARIYFAGGATAVLIGWRPTTIDIDMRIERDSDDLLRAIPEIKESLQVNIELASPLDFIPVAPDWEKRSPFIEAQGNLSYYHFDLYAQALSKLERSHHQDRDDLKEMIDRGLVLREEALRYFEAIEHELYRFPAIDARKFAESVRAYFGR